MISLVPPTLNIKGSEATDLGMQRLKIADAIDAAIALILQAAPQERDYPDALSCRAARDAFMERMRILRDMRAEFYGDLAAILKQVSTEQGEDEGEDG